MPQISVMVQYIQLTLIKKMSLCTLKVSPLALPSQFFFLFTHTTVYCTDFQE